MNHKIVEFSFNLESENANWSKVHFNLNSQSVEFSKIFNLKSKIYISTLYVVGKCMDCG